MTTRATWAITSKTDSRWNATGTVVPGTEYMKYPGVEVTLPPQAINWIDDCFEKYNRAPIDLVIKCTMG